MAGGGGEGVSPSAALKDQGNEQFKSGSYLKAAALYTQAIKLDPDNATLYRFLSAPSTLPPHPLPSVSPNLRVRLIPALRFWGKRRCGVVRPIRVGGDEQIAPRPRCA
jgi:hypothetical protein